MESSFGVVRWCSGFDRDLSGSGLWVLPTFGHQIWMECLRQRAEEAGWTHHREGEPLLAEPSMAVWTLVALAETLPRQGPGMGQAPWLAGSFSLVQEDRQEATRSRRSFDAGEPLAKWGMEHGGDATGDCTWTGMQQNRHVFLQPSRSRIWSASPQRDVHRYRLPWDQRDPSWKSMPWRTSTSAIGRQECLWITVPTSRQVHCGVLQNHCERSPTRFGESAMLRLRCWGSAGGCGEPGWFRNPWWNPWSWRFGKAVCFSRSWAQCEPWGGPGAFG